MLDKETFQAAFGGGASVTVQVDYTALQKAIGTTSQLNWIEAKWTGQPTPETIPQYVAWMHTVMSQVAKRVQQDIMYGYPGRTLNQPRYFVYRADGSYEEVHPE